MSLNPPGSLDPGGGGGGLAVGTQQDFVLSGGVPTSPGILWRATFPDGSGMASGATYRPFQFQQTVTATDLDNTRAFLGLDSNVTYGDSVNGGTGTAHAVTADVLVNGNSNNLDEFASIAGTVKFAGNPFPQVNPGRMWVTDFRGHGPIGVQPHMLSGENMFLNNYFNGVPIKGSAAVGVYTFPGIATGAPWNAALTYPVDAGIVVAGSAGDPAGTKNSRQGFTTGIRIGGAGVAWDLIPSSRIGTGIALSDYEAAGITVGNPFAAAAIGINFANSTLAYGIDLKGGTFNLANAIRLGNAQRIVARNAADNGDIEILQLNSGSVVVVATAFRFTATGLGFFGTGAQTKQTVSGAWAGNAAGKALSTALAAYGLITDSTTA